MKAATFENIPEILDAPVGDAVAYLESNPGLLIQPCGVVRAAVCLATDIEFSARVIRADDPNDNVSTQRHTSTEINKLSKGHLTHTTDRIDPPIELHEIDSYITAVVIDTFPSAERYNEFIENVLGHEPGNNAFRFANANPADQSGNGHIDGTVYRQALANKTFLRSSVPGSTLCFLGEYLADFYHDRLGLHDTTVLSSDPDYMTQFHMKLRTMTQSDFLSWFEDKSAYIGSLTCSILIGDEIDRYKGVFSGWVGDEQALEALCELYGYRVSRKNKDKTLVRYSEHLAELEKRVLLHTGNKSRELGQAEGA